MGEFTGQVALVTGSMSGMGEAIAARLASEGATVVLN
jgi:NAD(P)-dependent dehydrogenase (short-subunit alcohol dehydrogenase family)